MGLLKKSGYERIRATSGLKLGAVHQWRGMAMLEPLPQGLHPLEASVNVNLYLDALPHQNCPPTNMVYNPA